MNTGFSNLISLDEERSRAILSRYEIPFVNSEKALSKEDAIAKADKVGFPVVVKGLGKELLHKTDMGLVHVKVSDVHLLKAALDDIEDKAGDKLEGFTIQEYFEGNRELVAGLIRDEIFGHVIMFGLGGILTEALSDVSFRLAPLSGKDCEDMIEDLRSKKILEEFRGDKAINKRQIYNILLSLSMIAVDHPEISEIDINPLIAGKDGALKAADALVVKNENYSSDGNRRTNYYDLFELFNPDSIAFVGASTQLGKWGHILPTMLLSGGFEGEVYLVNPKGGSFAGRTIYPSVLDIPHEIDLAVVTLRAHLIESLFDDFIKKGIKTVLVVSSGFSEVGPEGKKMEEKLVELAAASGITLIGPNLMGFCNPAKRLNITIFAPQPVAGNISILSQSGNVAGYLITMFRNNDLGISCMCTNGNEAMVKTEDYIEYFFNDERTKVLSAYIEKINGKEFFDNCRKLTNVKPFIVLKGGRSKTGMKAASSHTGGMTSDNRLFEAGCRQSGVMLVDNLTQLMDVSAALSHLPLPGGKRIAIITMGGGFGVITADYCDKNGLSVPDLSKELIREFDTYFPSFWSRSNPVDMVNDSDKTLPFKVMETMAKWEGCDAIIHLSLFEQGDLQRCLAEAIKISDKTSRESVLQEIIRKSRTMDEMVLDIPIELMKKYNKPIIGVGSWMRTEDTKIVFKSDESGLGTIFFPTPERAAYAVAKLCEYGEYRNQ